MTLAPAAGPPSGTSSPPPIAFSVAAPGSAKSRIGEDEDESIGPARSGGVWGGGRASTVPVPRGGGAPRAPPPSPTPTPPPPPARDTAAEPRERNAAPPRP